VVVLGRLNRGHPTRPKMDAAVPARPRSIAQHRAGERMESLGLKVR
jgi:hypothetical protein